MIRHFIVLPCAHRITEYISYMCPKKHSAFARAILVLFDLEIISLLFHPCSIHSPSFLVSFFAFAILADSSSSSRDMPVLRSLNVYMKLIINNINFQDARQLNNNLADRFFRLWIYPMAWVDGIDSSRW